MLLRLAVSVFVTFAIPVVVWFWLYPTFGYGPSTLLVAQALTLIAAAGLVAALRLSVRDLGLDGRSLRDAAVIGLLAYGVLLLLAAGVNALFDADFTLFRSRYQLAALVDNWLLTALPESLLFAGVLFGLVRARLGANRAWLAVGLVAAAFALWHLAGYVAIGYGAASIAGRLALNLASWLIFGTIYALSGNLWLVVVAHAATDYGLSPLVTNEPLFGLLFMALLIAGAYRLRRRNPHADPDAVVSGAVG